MNPHVHAEAFARVASELPDDLDIAMSLGIRLHRNGSLSVAGPIGDPAFCRKLMDNAWEAIQRHQKADQPLVVPGRDVDCGQFVGLGGGG